MPLAKILFPLFLILTVALLGAVVVTGLKGRVKQHLVLVALTVSALGATIVFAKELGKFYDLTAAGTITPVHLALAKLATLSYLAPLISGWMTLRDRRFKTLHFRMAMLTLTLTVAAAVTGTWMMFAATPLP